MTELDFLEAVGRVDERYVVECLNYHKPRRSGLRYAQAAAWIAACLLMIVSASLIFLHQPIVEVDGFCIQGGVLLAYTGDDTEVNIPETVREIADYAFYENANASQIEVINLGAGTKKVSVNSFAGLTGLIELKISAENKSFVYEDGIVMTADGEIFLKYERTGETSYTLPESVKYIAAHAFQNCDLESVDFGDSLTYVGYNAFADCHRLTAINLPDSVTIIDEGAFAYCTSAVDGHIPDSAYVGNNAFEAVPFYLTRLAGLPCPLEEIKRGLITPSQAIQRSNLDSLEAQIEYVLASLAGIDYTPDDAAKFAYGAVHSMPEVPEGYVIPTEFTWDQLTYADRGWGNTGIYDVQILLPCDGFTIVMQAYSYDTNDALYWSDVRFRLTGVFLMSDETGESAEDSHGWSYTFDVEDGIWKAITFTHEDGRIVRSAGGRLSMTEYRLIWSPEGTRCAVEWTNGGQTFFYIQILNNDKVYDYYDYNDYINKYFGEYQTGTLVWVDEDTVEGENEFGRFSFDVFDVEPVQLTWDEWLHDPNNTERVRVTHQSDPYPVTLDIPATWSLRTVYYDNLREDAGKDGYRLLFNCGILMELMTDSQGEWSLENLRGTGWLNDNVVDILYGTSAQGYDYVILRNVPRYYETHTCDDKEGQYIVVFRVNGKAVFNFALTVYEDDADTYLEDMLYPIIDSVTIMESE
ncbi:MAG: leucine-rich repeat domain-containing protein [Clostridia bacterium]|nr:leucine-rich repeat domain-containing protein [Clostridia bacterium]